MNDEVFTGFTPVPDCIRDQLGPIPANVFGVVWRFTKRRRGECDARLENIAARAGYGTTTTRSSLRVLAANGWIVEEARKGKPTLYRDAGRWTLAVVGEDAGVGETTPTPDVALATQPQRHTLPTPTRGVAPCREPQRVALATPTRGVAKEEGIKKEQPNNADALGGAREPKPEAEAQPARAAFGAICDAIGQDSTMVSANDRRAIANLAKECRERGITDAQIRAAGERWYTVKWCFKPRETVRPPSVAQLRTWLGQCYKGPAAGARAETILSADTIRARWPGLTVERDGRLRVKGINTLAAEGYVERDSYVFHDRSTWPADVRECLAAVEALHAPAVLS